MKRSPDGIEEPYDPRPTVTYTNGNGANKIVWGFSAVAGAILLTLAGVVSAKVFDVSERLARLETIMAVWASSQGLKVPE